MYLSGRRRYGAVALLMAAIVAVSAAVTAFTRVTVREDGRLRLVASFYPVYIAALNVTDGVDGVQVVNLVPSLTGCLHDFQLSPDNMITLTGADALLLNGAGAEPFLDTVRARFPSLAAIDCSEGVALLESHEAHHHDHGGEPHPEEEHAYNEHIWTGPDRYIHQIENLRDGLAALDPGHADAYRANAAAYIGEIEAVRDELLEAAANLPTDQCITFHDSMAYLADELGLQTIAALSMGEESGLSASDLAQAEQAASAAGRVILLYDQQYPLEYASIGEGASMSRTVSLNAAVTGDNQKDAWLAAMRQNAAALRAVSV